MTHVNDMNETTLATKESEAITPVQIEIPELCLVVLIGASGAGKSTFAKEHFLPTEVLSSDVYRGIVSNDPNNQQATNDAFDLLHYTLRMRLRRGLLTVVDATNVQRDSRRSLVQIAKEENCLSAAIVLHPPESVCKERNQKRDDRNFGPHVIRRHRRDLRQSLKHLKREGFRSVKVLRSVEDVEAATIVRTKLWNDKKELEGPFDIIGDIHGCFDELKSLLCKLGYDVQKRTNDDIWRWEVTPPEGRTALFLGDLVDRGPNTPEVLSLVMSMVKDGSALCVCGNHEAKLLRSLQGKKVNTRHGLAESLEQLAKESDSFNQEVVRFLDRLISHYMLEGGALCIAHAGLKESYQGRASGRVRSFAMYGDTSGEVDQFGLPVRHDWASEYRGEATVVYGHTPTLRAEWFNGTICIDTGCVFGGKLTALRYPERELVDVVADQVYCVPAKPLEPQGDPRDLQLQDGGLLDIQDVTGKRFLATRLNPKIAITAERAAATLESMTRFAVDPRWLIYVPPTMSPNQTSKLPGLLEHPAEAFEYYQEQGIEQVVCQAKHMGSRAIVILLKDPEVARTRFGFDSPEEGMIYTRTGRRFFNDLEVERALLEHGRHVATEAGWFDAFKTDWICLDCELMPWSAKAQGLIRRQYAAVGAAATLALPKAAAALAKAASRGLDVESLASSVSSKTESTAKFKDAYRHYCWEVKALADYKIAPFHLLATEGHLHVDQNHLWHMTKLGELAASDPKGIFSATSYRTVSLRDAEAVASATSWWEERVGRGEEGMVVKPLDFIARGDHGRLVQPAVKCRGPEYLRIIYGPEYLVTENLERLRSRNVRRKRSLALREFALGLDALERFVQKEPLRRVHERAFGVLALECEPVDPRL